jgi:hypothetical protein
MSDQKTKTDIRLEFKLILPSLANLT